MVKKFDDKHFTRMPDGVLRLTKQYESFTRKPEMNEAVEFRVYNHGSVVDWKLGCGATTSHNFQSCYCQNAAKHDPDENGNGTRCGIHSKATIKKRRDKQDAKWAAQRAIYDARNARMKHKEDCVALVKEIADGHNDPRTACIELINAKENAK
tara:strand:+ start:246 stop:704 length:459 start_codon:yes stop_codon:yes gene_type:complete